MKAFTLSDLKDSVPNLKGSILLPSIEGPIKIFRDFLGIPHVQATTIHDAFFGQGFVIAQDRLWQMDFDRHRAEGRTAKLIGKSGLDLDITVRRMGIKASAQRDYEAANSQTQSMLKAYSEGVNAFINSCDVLPIEFRLLEMNPAPWDPIDCLAVAKIRHVFMGNYDFKLWRAKVLSQVGPKFTKVLYEVGDPGDLLIIPSGEVFTGESNYGSKVLDTNGELLEMARTLETAEGSNAGSNSWALAGHKTATGKPLLAGDPHRAPDTPNAYVQNHIACPDFDVIGLSFAGVPGFMHFGHNEKVAWCITHASADYQDLFIEKLIQGDPPKYEFKNEKYHLDIRKEIIEVRDEDSVEIEVASTHHGPVIIGSVSQGLGISFRHSAIAEHEPWAEAILDMLLARNVDQFEESMRHWVDPCNNLLSADVDGNISYQMRGKLPVRSRENSWLPVPGWNGEHEWTGRVPFEENPRLRNPSNGFIVTANNRITGPPYPHYISIDFSQDHRANRLLKRIRALGAATTADMALMHADSISIPAQKLVPHLLKLKPSNNLSLQVLRILGEWDYSMNRDQSAAAIYSTILTILLNKFSLSLLGEELTNEAIGGANRGAPSYLRNLKSLVLHAIENDEMTLLPEGQTWSSVLEDALSEATLKLQNLIGDDPQNWQWGLLHKTKHSHPLSQVFPELEGMLDPPAISCSGDDDTPLAGTYNFNGSFILNSTSLARYVYDLSDWQNCHWVIPLGSSGHPGSSHYFDQMNQWASIGLYPMLYDWGLIESTSETVQVINPED